MKFLKYKYNEDFVIKNEEIHLTTLGLKKSKKNLKKITGTRIAAVLGKNKYISPFQIWCDILGFYKSDFEDFFMNAGRVIEPKLVKFFSEQTNKNYITYDAKNIKFDLFKENEIFGGIPDGEEIKNNKVCTILEIKTASIDKYEWEFFENEMKLKKKNNLPIMSGKNKGFLKWFSNNEIIIPVEYKYQLSLYLYLRNISEGYFCIAFLSTEDYLNPENFKIILNNENNLDESKKIIFEKIEINLKSFSKVVDYCEKWYKSHILKGVSPKMKSTDLNWFRFGYTEI